MLNAARSQLHVIVGWRVLRPEARAFLLLLAAVGWSEHASFGGCQASWPSSCCCLAAAFSLSCQQGNASAEVRELSPGRPVANAFFV